MANYFDRNGFKMAINEEKLTNMLTDYNKQFKAIMMISFLCVICVFFIPSSSIGFINIDQYHDISLAYRVYCVSSIIRAVILILALAKIIIPVLNKAIFNFIYISVWLISLSLTAYGSRIFIDNQCVYGDTNCQIYSYCDEISHWFIILYFGLCVGFYTSETKLWMQKLKFLILIVGMISYMVYLVYMGIVNYSINNSIPTKLVFIYVSLVLILFSFYFFIKKFMMGEPFRQCETVVFVTLIIIGIVFDVIGYMDQKDNDFKYILGEIGDGILKIMINVWLYLEVYEYIRENEVYSYKSIDTDNDLL